jgi:transcription elongation GreA/GreB family factor
VNLGARSDYVHVGTTVIVRDRDGARDTYVIVPPAEAQPRSGRISKDSPLGRALLGRQVGESVLIPAPGGSFTVTVESIG